MKVKVIIEGVGVNHARVEVEDDCGLGGIGGLLEQINNELPEIHTPQPSFSGTDSTRNGSFEPASEGAMRALWAAAKNNGTELENVCKEYGVDPAHVSKRECWQMTQALNAKSGYQN